MLFRRYGAGALALVVSLAAFGLSPTAVALAADTGAPAAEAGSNLLANSDFSRGAGRSPDDWRTAGWKEAPSVTGYDWLHSPGSELELVVTNFQPNDARWVQSLSLGPGWYYVSVEARTENVPSDEAGASISLDEDSINSPDLRGTTDWQRLGFYIEVGKHGADMDIALRLGNFGSLSTGRAIFRNPSLVKVAAPPAGATPVFDLVAVRRGEAAPPIGHLWTLIATFVLLALVAAAGWHLYGSGDLAPAAPAPRAKGRRRSGRSAQRPAPR